MRVPAPDKFKVKFETTKGEFVLEITKDLAPIGVERFHELIENGFYDRAKFFRVVPDFVVQFGLAADPAMTKRFDARLKDDPVKASNAKGCICFAMAGPNSRTTQVFISLRDNAFLDRQGFAPFGQVVSGMDVVASLYSGYGDNGPDQGRLRSMGNAYVEQSFPKLDGIVKASFVTE